ncbi:MAG: BlaI/MecI/CopY family transcriptional regulator [Bdellovibrionales bacterium]
MTRREPKLKDQGKDKDSDRLLTPVELELMTIIWRLGEASVSDVLEHLSGDRQLAYTSVSTILRILEQKGVLKPRKEGRGHVYIPVLSKAEFETKTLKHVVERVFDGTPVALVRHLLGHVPIEANEIEELKELIRNLEKKK